VIGWRRLQRLLSLHGARRSRRLPSRFVLWAVVQLVPNFTGAATLNEIVILLFAIDLAIVLSPAR
jgi:hypothetical protein